MSEIEIAERLRKWIHRKYGKWITHATAHQAVKFMLTDPKRKGTTI